MHRTAFWLVALSMWALASSPTLSIAQGLDLAGIGARAIGHAGAAVVSSDDHGALLYNPAGMARRRELRIQIDLGIADRDVRHASTVFEPETTGEVREQAGGDLILSAGIQRGIGRRVVIGASYLSPTVVNLAWAVPLVYDRPPFDEPLFEERTHDFPQRYAATHLSLSRRGPGVGISFRALPSLAIGASTFLWDMRLTEGRTAWGGFPEDEPFSRDFDMDFVARGRDSAVPSLALGLLFAPESLPLELGASLFWSADGNLEGTPSLRDSRGGIETEEGKARYAVANVYSGALAKFRLPMPLVARGGLRLLTPRIALELAGELAKTEPTPLDWSVRGVTLTPIAGDEKELRVMPAAFSFQDTYALRAALELDVVPGFLTMTLGYAFSRGSSPKAELSAAFADLDAHLVSIGAEARVSGATLIFGLARSSLVREVVGKADSQVFVLSPLGPQAAEAGSGTYSGSAVQVGVSLEIAR
ncbi:MAG: hypothetical protein HY698_18835 [Deltaproteobacteria bacterium]|nr:hypothetical protein [Deltaproteobacteria bacterium]